MIASNDGPWHFERLVGPVETVQREWHGYLLVQAQRAKASSESTPYEKPGRPKSR